MNTQQSTMTAFHPRILSSEVDTYLNSPAFRHRLYRMKVGASIRVPFVLDARRNRALQERVWRLNEGYKKEFRSFVSKRTGNFFIFRIA
jgi:hypothetical protein